MFHAQSIISALSSRHDKEAADSEPRSHRALLVRQPIVDKHDAVVGYELRLEGGHDGMVVPSAEAGPILLELAQTAEFAELAARKLTCLTLPGSDLSAQALQQLPRDITVAVTVPDPLPDPFAEDLQALTQSGIKLALDYDPLIVDRFSDEAALATHRTLAGITKLVRLDVGNCDAVRLAEAVQVFRQFPGVKLMATNLACHEEFEACGAMPFDFMHGRYFMRSIVHQDVKADPTRTAVVELLNRTRSGAEVRELELIFKRDPLLAYRLLRFINSPGCGMVHEIRSISHALVALGYNQLYRWLTLLLLSRAGQGGSAFITNALTRGRLMELLGDEKLPRPARDGLFIAGVFSLLDALLGVPLKVALADIRLSAEVEDALLRAQGPLAPFVDLALACEQGWQEKVEVLAERCGRDVEEVNIAHVHALVWAESISA